MCDAVTKTRNEELVLPQKESQWIATAVATEAVVNATKMFAQLPGGFITATQHSEQKVRTIDVDSNSNATRRNSFFSSHIHRTRRKRRPSHAIYTDRFCDDGNRNSRSGIVKSEEKARGGEEMTTTTKAVATYRDTVITKNALSTIRSHNVTIVSVEIANDVDGYEEEEEEVTIAPSQGLSIR